MEDVKAGFIPYCGNFHLRSTQLTTFSRRFTILLTADIVMKDGYIRLADDVIGQIKVGRYSLLGR